MMGHVFAWFVGIFLLRTDFSDGQYSCTDLQPFEHLDAINISMTWPFCDNFQATVSTTSIYLDSQNIDTIGIGECTCTISANRPNLISTNISNVPTSEPGVFDIVVDGQKVELPVTVNYESPVDITLRKPKRVPVKQCIKVAAESTVNGGTFDIRCTTRRNIVPTTRIQIVPTSKIQIVPTTQTPPVAVYVYAVVPAVALLLIVAVVGVLLWRRRKHSRGRPTEPPAYVNTMILDESVTHNADSVPQYENDVNDHEHSNRNNYSCLEPQREQATTEHLYSGLEPERDLSSNTNVDCVPETEQESNRHVYDNDYSRLETQSEREPDEHPYSDVDARCDLANITYANTDTAHEN